jgi:hypothetical protein
MAVRIRPTTHRGRGKASRPGKWEGDVLTVETTHPEDRLHPSQRITAQRPRRPARALHRNGDVLTWISIVNDPAYLTEPYIKSRNFYQGPGLSGDVVSVFGRRGSRSPRRRDPALPARHEPVPAGVRRALSRSVRRDTRGAETMYPEYRGRLKTMTPPPPLKKPEPAAPAATPPRGRGEHNGTRTV